MPIRFRCAYCNQLMGIARRKAGQVVKCPKCAGEIIVPVPEGTEQPEATERPANPGGPFDVAQFDPAAPAPLENAAALPAEPLLAPLPPAPKRVGVFLSVGMLVLCIIVVILLLILTFVLGLIIGRQPGPPEAKAAHRIEASRAPSGAG